MSAERQRWRTDGERGNVLAFTVISMFAVVSMVALATDGGRFWATRTEVQTASDSAALAAAGALITGGGTTVDLTGATSAAQTFGASNEAARVGVSILAGDIAFGSWDLDSRTFTELPGSTDPDVVRAARVMGRRDGTANGPMPTIFSRAFGITELDVRAQAVGYLGFAGMFPPGTLTLPMGIDCCAIGCTASDQEVTEAEYCAAIQTQTEPPCLLEEPLGERVDHCLRFDTSNPSGPTTQNACWSEFGTDSSVSVPELLAVVNNANGTTVGSSAVNMDNGDKAPVLTLINDKFKGIGEFAGYPPAGTHYHDEPAGPNSWVVPMLVVECQNPGDGCATNTNAEIKGAVCFEIREIIDTGNPKGIKGRFLCPADDLFGDNCGAGGLGPGGEDFGIDAQAAVLVQ